MTQSLRLNGEDCVRWIESLYKLPPLNTPNYQINLQDISVFGHNILFFSFLGQPPTPRGGGRHPRKRQWNCTTIKKTKNQLWWGFVAVQLCSCIPGTTTLVEHDSFLLHIKNEDHFSVVVQIEKFLLTSKQKRDHFSICEYRRHFKGRLMYSYQWLRNSREASLAILTLVSWNLFLVRVQFLHSWVAKKKFKTLSIAKNLKPL